MFIGMKIRVHGNATNISEERGHVALFRPLGASVFLLDYRGYGKSEGQPTEAGTEQDAEAAWRYLIEERKIPTTRLLYYGHSLGGGVALGLAVTHPPAKLILEGTFTSIPDRAAELYLYLPVRHLARIFYPNVTRLPQVNVPVLIIHSQHDRVIPFAHGQRLYEIANAPKRFHAAEGSHRDGFTAAGPVSTHVLKAFLDDFRKKKDHGGR